MRQEMSMQAKRELLDAIRPIYKNASLKEKTELLNGFIAGTGYSRKHAVWLLTRGKIREKATRKRARTYDDAVVELLREIWNAANNICAKRLIPFLPNMLDALERCGHISVEDPLVRERLLSISPATADRLLKPARARLTKSISTTKPGNVLRSQISVRTFADWTNVVPGLLEADLVSHNGGNVNGQCIHTLTVTDIATGWTELTAAISKEENEVLSAFKSVRQTLPFTVLGLDTDNGSEFINHDLASYCEAHSITFTRSRPYKKNDQAHVEEKNGSIVRRLVGYNRYQGDSAVKCMNQLYKLARLYVNFFQPSSKLLSKVRTGSQVKKTYDKAKTPYQRLCEYPMDMTTTTNLEHTFDSLDPLVLLEKIGSLQRQLGDIANQLEHQGESYKPCVASAKQKRPRIKRPVQNRTPSARKKGAWSKRKDPLSNGIWEWACAQLQNDPSLGQRRLLAMLIKKFPRRVSKRQSTTVASRLKCWRDAHPEFIDRFPPAAKKAVKNRLIGKVKEVYSGTILNEAMRL